MRDPVTPATATRNARAEGATMSEILVPATWRERLEELVGRRRDVWLVAALIVVAVLAAFVLRSRSA